MRVTPSQTTRVRPQRTLAVGVEALLSTATHEAQDEEGAGQLR